MKFYVLLSFFGLLLHRDIAYGQPLLKSDTSLYINKIFNDSLSLKKLIDTIFEHKGENLSNTLMLCTYAYNRALEIKNQNLQARALNIKAAAYEDVGDYQKALKLHYQALRLFEKNGGVYNIAMLNNNIGRVYLETGKLNDAISYLSKAEGIANQNRLNKVLVYIYANFANTYIQLNQLKRALKYALRSDSLNNNLHIKALQAANDGNIGALYYFMKDMDKALKYYNQSKALALQANDIKAFYMQNVNIGEVYETTHTADALPYYQQALQYFAKIKDYAHSEYAANDISNYYKTKGNYQLALQYYQQSVKANQENKSIQAAKNMSFLQTQYETEKKVQQIKLLNKENTIQKLSIGNRNKTIAIIIGLFMLSGILGILIYYRNKLKQRSLMQQQMLKQQAHLTQAVIEAEEKERKRIASDLHDGVGQLFSAVKMNLNGLLGRVNIDREEDRFLAEKTMALVDESCKEVRFISHQMMPNMLLRSGIASDVKSFIEKIDSETLKVHVEANGFKNRLESNVETVLYRVIQETVNNVIKHAKASTLHIRLDRDVSGINAMINDDGIGFNIDLISDFNGIGLKNITARIEYLKGTVEYESVIGEGTSVKIWVPVE